MKNVLILAYYFPPMGGSGVQRPVKFVKYLEQFGYSPRVVALDGSIFNGQMPKDCEMLGDIAGKDIRYVTLNRRETLQAKLASTKLTQYTPSLHWSWWTQAARRTCDEAFADGKPDVLFATVSPFASARAASDIARKYDIPWVLDMRDPWALDPISFYPSKLHYLSERRAMRAACRDADAVIMNTPQSLGAVKAAFPEVPTEKLFAITNGWDSDDFNGFQKDSGQRDKKLTIVHTGRFYTGYSARVNPWSRSVLFGRRFKPQDLFRYSFGKSNMLARTPYYLFAALKKLMDESAIREEDIRLVFVGQTTSEDKKLVELFGLEKMAEFKGYLNHRDSVSVLQSADVLFLPLHEPDGGKSALIVPGKTYEYIASGVPILGLLPPGDAREFIMRSGLGFICEPTNIEQIAVTVLDLVRRHRTQGIAVMPDHAYIGRFERRNLTRKLSEVLDFAIKHHGHNEVLIQ